MGAENKNEKNIKYGIASNNIPINKQIDRNNKKLCTFTHYDKNGHQHYSCPNRVNNYYGSIGILNGMLCDKHLKKMSNKYLINFKKEIPKLVISKFYSYDFNETLLIKSLNKKFQKELEEQKIKKIMDPEFYGGNEKNSLKGLPNAGFDQLELELVINQDSVNQGSLNGPDFVFKNIKNQTTIGLEIVSGKGNTLDGFKKIDQFEKYTKEKNLKYQTMEQEIDDLKEIINKKNRKKYFQCNELYLGIVVKDTIAEWQYLIFELIINQYNKQINSNFKGVFIL